MYSVCAEYVAKFPARPLFTQRIALARSSESLDSAITCIISVRFFVPPSKSKFRSASTSSKKSDHELELKGERLTRADSTGSLKKCRLNVRKSSIHGRCLERTR